MALTITGFVLMGWVFYEVWFIGLIRTDILAILAPMPYVVLGIDHLRNGRRWRGVIFLTALGLLISEISPFRPYSFLPDALIVLVNVLTSITIPLSIYLSIVDVVKRKK